MKKQTSVEWLSKKTFIPVYLLEQAKEMEKEQMENVWHDSRIEDFGDEYIGKQTSFNDYYNETYKSE